MSTVTQVNPAQFKSTRHSKIMSEAWSKCEAFNSKHPVGTKVRYRELVGQATNHDIKETTIRSEAWTLPSGVAVVLIDGKSGGVSLDHIEVISS